MEFKHISVLLQECIDNLNLKENGVYLDGTLGGGGHTLHILESMPTASVLAIDKDCDALVAAGNRLAQYSNRIKYIHDDFHNAPEHIDRYYPDGIDGALLDLGVSSYQIDTADRGFSYMHDALLDMRMDQNQSLSAFNVVNEYSEYDLNKIFFEYGEERFSRRIAAAIVKARQDKNITTTGQLVSIIENAVPASQRYKGGHPAKRVFQAIRIEVNGELNGLAEAVENIAMRLKKGGRMCVITFHSLEDRIVKNVFRRLETDCICDKSSPICTCSKRREAIILTKKPITASQEELDINSRSSSAKLRVIERV